MIKNLKSEIRKVLAITLVISASLSGSIYANNKNNLNSEMESKIQRIKLYEEPSSKERVKASMKFEDINKKIVNYYKKTKGVEISGDINDKQYQQQIKNLGTDLEILGEDNKEELLEFVKFIDLYENIEKNKEIKELLNKYENSNIELEEAEYLISISPIQGMQSTSEEPSLVDGDVDESLDKQRAFANGYSQSNAVNYAYKWTDNYKKLRNTSQYGYYSVNGADCTNFVSQCLKAGGMKNRTGSYISSSSWYYNNTKPSHTWGGAHNFYNHWRNRAGVASSVSNLRGGDVVSADFDKDGDIDHSAIITKNTATSTSNTASHKYLTQHSTDREEYHVGNKKSYTLKYWYDSGYKVYGYEMDKASN